MVAIIAILIVLIVIGSFLMLSPESIPEQVGEFGGPIFGAGLVGLIIFVILRMFGVIR